VAPDVAQTTLRVSYSKRTYVGCTTRAAQIGDLNSTVDMMSKLHSRPSLPLLILPDQVRG
jgi:hypothetical protein